MMSEARRYKYHRVFDGYNFLSAQGEMEQIVGSDMELVSAEDYDALEADNAALRRAKAEGWREVIEGATSLRASVENGIPPHERAGFMRACNEIIGYARAAQIEEGK